MQAHLDEATHAVHASWRSVMCLGFQVAQAPRLQSEYKLDEEQALLLAAVAFEVSPPRTLRALGMMSRVAEHVISEMHPRTHKALLAQAGRPAVHRAVETKVILELLLVERAWNLV